MPQKHLYTRCNVPDRQLWILSKKGRVTFEEVAVWFSREEWEMLADWQKELYRAVMLENYENLFLLAGHADAKPEIITKLERGGELCVEDQQAPEGREILPNASRGFSGG
ncbi:protein ZNF783-like [Mauremys reevesii]|uniref:protein ZNF783-like n=1 Tax=Mauremys reevesii TaxID=260615 RepID=UPI00193F3726|nr:protein ZNF783-like [Mauremys reevesii]